MILHCYITEQERETVFEFFRSRSDIHVLGFHPGDPEGLNDESIRHNPIRFISLWPEGEVATQVISTNSGELKTYSTVRTPLIEWQVPFQKRDLIIAGRFELEEYSTMEVGGPYRKEYLASKKLFNQIRKFLDEQFVKVSDGLFNGPEALALFEKGYKDAPFDPDKTTWESVTVD